MQQLMAVNGSFPEQGPGNAQFTIGMVESFAGGYPAWGAPACTGQLLPIIQYQPLTAVIGLNFGGDGEQHIGLPNLHGRVTLGGAPIGRMTQGGLTMTWLIATMTGGDAPVLGMLVPFGGTYAPSGWAVCDGSTLPVRQNVALYQAIGAAFGGSDGLYFQLPDLNGAAPIGVGLAVALGQKVAGTIDGLGLHYLINTSGPLAPATGNGAPPAGSFYAGQVIAFAGAQVPPGWAVCDGSLLAVSGWPVLFQAIGNVWGGDGKTSFALPDLRGKMLAGG
ncbi:tail fiber protein [Sphingomonas sp. R-74633]|uniref:tail fiber protein n=1 Tax=Sphingomonas sp. R-74633 TaxID=2751188 RepID=UPI0015D2CDD1|nr:tail fiber protein [Sphingomonas sp. R-74633]NYT42893.1 tail fiber protein [Sphingomonas sp. R-74633]